MAIILIRHCGAGRWWETVRRVALLTALAPCAQAAAPDDDEIARRVKTDLATEYAECGAHFAVVAEGLRRSLPEGAARDRDVAAASKFGSGAFKLATALRSEERTIAVAKDTTDRIKRLIDNSFENLARAADEYGYRCRDLIEDPKARTQYWLDRERSSAPR